MWVCVFVFRLLIKKEVDMVNIRRATVGWLMVLRRDFGMEDESFLFFLAR